MTSGDVKTRARHPSPHGSHLVMRQTDPQSKTVTQHDLSFMERERQSVRGFRRRNLKSEVRGEFGKGKLFDQALFLMIEV